MYKIGKLFYTSLPLLLGSNLEGQYGNRGSYVVNIQITSARKNEDVHSTRKFQQPSLVDKINLQKGREEETRLPKKDKGGLLDPTRNSDSDKKPKKMAPPISILKRGLILVFLVVFFLYIGYSFTNDSGPDLRTGGKATKSSVSFSASQASKQDSEKRKRDKSVLATTGSPTSKPTFKARGYALLKKAGRPFALGLSALTCIPLLIKGFNKLFKTVRTKVAELSRGGMKYCKNSMSTKMHKLKELKNKIFSK
jgi:hypothetical protein